MLATLRAAVSKVRKAVVAAAAVAVIAGLKKIGVELDNETVATILDALVVSAVVWAVPNAKPYVQDEV